MTILEVTSSLLFGICLLLLSGTHAQRTLRGFKRHQKLHLEEFQKKLSDNFLFFPLGKIYALWLLASILSLFLFVATFDWYFMFLTASIFLLPNLFFHFIEQRRKKLFLEQFGKGLPQIVSILKAGHPIERALELLARTGPHPLSQELRMILNKIRLGHSFEASLHELQERFQDPDLDTFLRAVFISKKVGANLAETIEHVGETIRSRAAIRLQLRALTSQGRAQAFVAILMPFALGFVLEALSPGYLDPLFDTTEGNFTLLFSAFLLLLGTLSIWKICQVDSL